MTGPAMTAVVADDELNLRDYLVRHLQRVWPALQVVGQAGNGNEALEQIRRLRPDVAFLDIRMPGLSGIEVAGRIDTRTRVVFVTAYDEYAIEAFDKAAVDYLLKPVDDDRLRRTAERLASTRYASVDLDRLAQLMQGRDTAWLNWIRVGVPGETRIIPVEDVVFFKADQKYTTVRTLDGEFLIRKSIKDLEHSLDPDRFWRVHRSTLVNLAFIEAARRDFRGRFSIALRGLRQTLKVSDSYSHRFRQM